MNIKQKQSNLVHYLSCQAVRLTAYLNFCSGRVIKGLGLGHGLEGLYRLWP